MPLRWKRTPARVVKRWRRAPFTPAPRSLSRLSSFGRVEWGLKEWKYYDGYAGKGNFFVLRDRFDRPFVVGEYYNNPDSLVLFSLQREYPELKNGERKISMRDVSRHRGENAKAREEFAYAENKLRIKPTYAAMMSFLVHFRREILAGKKCYIQPFTHANWGELGEATFNKEKLMEIYSPIFKNFFESTPGGYWVDDNGDGVYRQRFALDLNKPLVREALGLPLMKSNLFKKANKK